MIHRREWLQQAGAAGALLGMGRHASAQATPTGDYKALVCVFLFGGNDGNNMVVPLGDAYADYAKARSSSGLAIAVDQLVPLAEEGAAARHGLHPALRPLEPLWARQRLAMLFNTGPLVEPITRAGYLKAAARPDNLFSHADQQELAQALSGSTSAGTGWGFRLAREAGFGGPRLPSLVSFSGNQRFLQGDVRQALVLPARGNFGLSGTRQWPDVASARMAAFRTMWAGTPSPIGAQAGRDRRRRLVGGELRQPDPQHPDRGQHRAVRRRSSPTSASSCCAWRGSSKRVTRSATRARFSSSRWAATTPT